MSVIEKVDVVVVGTGWNGLIAAKTYLDFEPKANLVMIDKQASIGGVWATDRIYPSLYAQSKRGLFEYSFYPMQNEGITKDGYISGQTINAYLTNFAQDYDLLRRIRFQTNVIKVERLAESHWRLQIEGKEPIECSRLIYASGGTSDPVLPSWPKSNFDLPIIHSADTGIHLGDIDKIDRAVVIGAAKSAFDTVFLLLNAGKKVDWVIRENGSGPVAIMPPTIFGLVNSIDVITTRFSTLFGSSIMKTTGIGHKIFQKTRLGRAVSRAWWRTVDTIAAMHAGYAKSPNAGKLRPIPHGNGVFWANAGLGAASVPNFWKVFHAGDCTVHRTEIESLTDNVVILKDGTKVETDYIIACTGFVKSCQPFGDELKHLCGLAADPLDSKKWAKLDADADQLVEDELPSLRNAPEGLTKKIDRDQVSANQRLSFGACRHYRRLISPTLAAMGDRSIFFPGMIHTICTPTVAEVQALWGVAYMLGLHDVPSQEEMDKEAAIWNVWTQKRYRGLGDKHSYAIFDFRSYIDQLLGDLHVRTQRKGNAISELFSPLYPRDYRGIVDEFRHEVTKRHFLGNGSSSTGVLKTNGILKTTSVPKLNGVLKNTGVSANGVHVKTIEVNGH